MVCDVEVVSEGSGLTYWSDEIMQHVDRYVVYRVICLVVKTKCHLVS